MYFLCTRSPAPNDLEIGVDLSILGSISGQFSEDYVILLSNKNYTRFGGVVYGIAECIGQTSCDVAVVRGAFSFLPRLSLVHEFAHLMGARHNISINAGGAGDDFNTCSHGWQFKPDGGFDRTIMAVLPSSAPNSLRIVQFSDPNATYNGYSLGTVDDNNTLSIKNFICGNTASFSTIRNFDANIDGLNSGLIKIGPNPVQDLLNVQFENPDGIHNLQIINLEGKLLYETDNIDNRHLDINMKNFGMIKTP